MNICTLEGDEQVEEAEKSEKSEGAIEEPERKQLKLDIETPVATKGIHVQLLW